MIWNCPVCGKAFDVLWPHQWAYKIGAQFACSWKCIRANEKQKSEGVKEMSMKPKIPEEAKKAAIQAALDGKDPYEPLAPYTTNPKSMWTYIRSVVKKKDPELFAKIPNFREVKKIEKPKATLADAMEGMQEAADEFFGQCEEMGLALGKDAPAKEKDLNFRIRSVQTDLGTYSVDDEYFEFKTADRKDAIELEIEDFVILAKELPKVMKLLGVSLEC